MSAAVRELACCEFCGRDTTAKSKICKRCTNGVSRHTPNKKTSMYDIKDEHESELDYEEDGNFLSAVFCDYNLIRKNGVGGDV